MERERCRDAVNCDGCSEAQSSADNEGCIGCRECMEQAMSHDVSQQKLQETKQRRSTDGHLTSARVTED